MRQEIVLQHRIGVRIGDDEERDVERFFAAARATARAARRGAGAATVRAAAPGAGTSASRSAANAARTAAAGHAAASASDPSATTRDSARARGNASASARRVRRRPRAARRHLVARRRRRLGAARRRDRARAEQPKTQGSRDGTRIHERHVCAENGSTQSNIVMAKRSARAVKFREPFARARGIQALR
jgi:hypothetical protein